MTPMLKEMVSELKEQAALHPLNPLSAISIAQLPYQHWRFVDINGILCHIQFTVSKVGSRSFWHLSCTKKHGDWDEPCPLPEETVKFIKCLFFSSIDEIIEIKSQLYPGVVRQFVQEKK